MSQSYSGDHSSAFDQMLDQIKSANQDLVNGDPVPMMELWSTAADVTILGEGGGYGLGWEQVGPILMAGAALFTSGHSPTHQAENAHAPGSGPPILDGSGHGHCGHTDTDVV